MARIMEYHVARLSAVFWRFFDPKVGPKFGMRQVDGGLDINQAIDFCGSDATKVPWIA